MSVLKYPTKEEGEARRELYYRNTDIWTAIRDGKYDRVKELLNNGENVNNVTRIFGSTLTCLMFASCNGHYDIVKLLLDKGADVNAENIYGETALIWALGSGNKSKDIVKLLEQYGAK